MPEALTESFCERCGTRYEFQAPTRLNPLRRGRGFVSGFKNYLLSQDALSDSIGDAMRAEEQDLASAQLEAFHAAFNFCINCRQYACNNCWNDADGRCRTCAPIPGTDDLVQRLEDAYRAERARSSGEAAEESELDASALQRRLGAEAWPSSDLADEGVPEAAPALEEAPLAAEAAPPPDLAPAPPPVLADATAPAPGDVEPTVPAAEVEFPPILGWEPDLRSEPPVPFIEPEPLSLPPTISEAPLAGVPQAVPVSEEPAAPPLPTEPVIEPPAAAEPPAVLPPPSAPPIERRPAPVEPPVPAAPVAAETVVPETPVAPEEPPAPAPTPMRPRRTPLSETFVRRAPRPSRPAREPAPTDDAALAARRAQLELLGIEDPGEGRVSTGQRPVLAYRSSGAAIHPSEASAPSAAGNAPSPLWDASSREVAAGLSAVAVQSCGSCGLSLSASARFCRRCGARQARSA